MADSKKNKIIAVELGGTFLRVGLVQNNKILKYIKKQTPKNKRKLLTELFNVIQDLMSRDVKGIGVASPGPLDSETGIIKNPPNYCLQNYNLKRILEKKFRTKVKIENDANCVALAELILGAGKNKKNFIVLTLGTGIGGGIIINKKMYNGNGYAGELGHIVIDNGKYFEDLASWKKIKLLTKKEFGKEIWVSELIKLKNKKSKKILQEMIKYLGQGIGSIINIFDPEIVILSGGMRHSGKKFLDSIKKETTKYVLFRKKLKIQWSKLKHPGISGAALLMKD
jgi:predicted NBD/HSP70 family sugar kinase